MPKTTEAFDYALKFATRHALLLGHEYIATEHILLGTLDVGGKATRLIEEWVSENPIIQCIRQEIYKVIRPGRGNIPSYAELNNPTTILLSPLAKKVREYAWEVARDDKSVTDTPHLVIGMLKEYDGLARQVLMNNGFPPDNRNKDEKFEELRRIVREKYRVLELQP